MSSTRVTCDLAELGQDLPWTKKPCQELDSCTMLHAMPHKAEWLRLPEAQKLSSALGTQVGTLVTNYSANGAQQMPKAQKEKKKKKKKHASRKLPKTRRPLDHWPKTAPKPPPNRPTPPRPPWALAPGPRQGIRAGGMGHLHTCSGAVRRGGPPRPSCDRCCRSLLLVLGGKCREQKQQLAIHEQKARAGFHQMFEPSPQHTLKGISHKQNHRIGFAKFELC